VGRGPADRPRRCSSRPRRSADSRPPDLLIPAGPVDEAIRIRPVAHPSSTCGVRGARFVRSKAHA
jgi:hypothetical protein